MAERAQARVPIHYLISEYVWCAFSVYDLNIFGLVVSSLYVFLYAILLFGVHKVSMGENLVWYC
jgi:hypothetical protein